MADNSLVYRKSRVKECLTGKRAKFSVDRYSYRPANRATHSATHQPNTIFKYIAVSNFDRAERPSGHTATIQLHRVHALHFEQDLRQDKIPAFGPLSLYLDIYIWGRTAHSPHHDQSSSDPIIQDFRCNQSSYSLGFFLPME